jgi:hypothetical protein
MIKLINILLTEIRYPKDENEFIAHAVNRIKKLGVKTLYKLQKIDGSLYQAIFIKNKQHPGIAEKIYNAVTDFNSSPRYPENEDAFIAYAVDRIKELGVKTISELNNIDSSFYQAIAIKNKQHPGIAKKIYDNIHGFKIPNKHPKDEDAFIAYAVDRIKELGVKTPGELNNINSGLFQTINHKNSLLIILLVF